MHFGLRFYTATLVSGLVLLAMPSHFLAQEPSAQTKVTAVEGLPDAPLPQFTIAAAEPSGVQAPASQGQSTQNQAPATTPPQNATAQGSSSSAPSAQQPREKSQHDSAQEQIKEQEKQRVLGILPSFNVSYRGDAVSLTAGQKMSLAFRSAIDPVTFAVAFVVAGYHEASDSDVGFPWGPKGYAERAGAAYLDAFDGTMIGNGILPSILHQDPRYFRLGHGTIRHRLLYAAASSFICKHDKTGKWEPNYSNVLGNIASGGLSNLYYPSEDSGVGLAISNGFIVTAEGGFGSIFQEFWPDIARKFLHKDPTHGLDAEARAADKAKKQAKPN